jgi:hypothetical protein
MENDVDKKLAEQYFPRFGKIAIDMGFVTVKQLKEAIIEQVDDDIADKPHRPIGKILLENSWITKEQIDIVLNELFKEHD